MTISVALTIPDSKPIIQFLKELNGVIANFEKSRVSEGIELEVAQEFIPNGIEIAPIGGLDKIWNECNLGNGKE